MIVRRHLLPRILGVALLVASGSFGASAQTTPAPAPASPPAASPEDIRRLVATLNDPTARAQLIGNLNAMLDADRHATPAAPTPSDWVGRTAGQISAGMTTLTAEAAATGEMAREWPRAMRWLGRRATDDAAREATLDLLARLAIVLIGAAAVEWLVAASITRPRRAIDQWSAHHASSRWLVLFVRVLLALVPISAFIGTAYAILPLTTPDETTRLVTVAVINANVLVRAILAAARRVLNPEPADAATDTRSRRLLRLDDASARAWYRWIRRLSRVGIYGFCLISAASLLGVPRSVRDLLLRVLGLIFAVMTVALIVHGREAVRRLIAGAPAPEGRAPDELRLLRGRLAEIWHVLAACYVMGVFVVWALDVPGGFTFLASATVWTVVTLALLRVGWVLVRRLSAQASQALVDPGAVTPTRSAGYLPLAQAAFRAILVVGATAVILQVWSIDVWGWLQSQLGHRILGSAISIAIILAVAVAVWEIASIMIARSLALGSALDAPHLRAVRLRTLLPLLRNVLSVVIVVLTTLVILPELGVDIAPLLAGAGVVGLAIGFGAQSLVKDVITGLFFLLEDTINVGDIVDVGGRSGLVESMSLRSIRLRDLEGSVHTVPFSAVSAVKNMTRGFGYAVLDVFVDYRSDLDRAIALLRECDEQMRADPQFGPMILAPLEVMGVERFADNAVVARCRSKTLPFRRWDVGREFNRRIKLGFDRAGIGMVAAVPPPHGTDDDGQKAGEREVEVPAAATH